MIQRLVFALALFAAASALAAAGGPARAEAPSGPLAVPRTNELEMPVLIAPVVVKDRLRGYIYLRVIVETETIKAVDDVRAKVPDLQNAFVFAVHRGSIVRDGDPTLLDSEGLGQRLQSEAAAILGPGIVTRVRVSDSTAPEPDPDAGPQAAIAPL